MQTRKIAMGIVADGAVRIRRGREGGALSMVRIPPSSFPGKTPEEELQARLRTLAAAGYEIVPWEGGRRRRPKGSAEAAPAAGPPSAAKTFPVLYARAKTSGIHPVLGMGPRIAEHFGEAVLLNLVQRDDVSTIDPAHGIANLFFALTEARAGRIALADDGGGIVDPGRWLKATGLLEDPVLLDAAQRFGLLGAGSLLKASAAEAWFA